MPDSTFITRYQEKNGYIIFPVALYSHPALKHLSIEALTLYGMLLCIQEQGSEVDENGVPCVHVTIGEIADVFRCGLDRAKRIFHEIDSNSECPLISTKKYASGHTVSYVRNDL